MAPGWGVRCKDPGPEACGALGPQGYPDTNHLFMLPPVSQGLEILPQVLTHLPPELQAAPRAPPSPDPHPSALLGACVTPLSPGCQQSAPLPQGRGGRRPVSPPDRHRLSLHPGGSWRRDGTSWAWE